MAGRGHGGVSLQRRDSLFLSRSTDPRWMTSGGLVGSLLTSHSTWFSGLNLLKSSEKGIESSGRLGGRGAFSHSALTAAETAPALHGATGNPHIGHSSHPHPQRHPRAFTACQAWPIHHATQPGVGVHATVQERLVLGEGWCAVEGSLVHRSWS